MQLHPDLSFCRIGETFIFLDSAKDRYFTLGASLSDAFPALLDGTAGEDAVRPLTQHGIVIAGADRPIAACPGDLPRASLLDGPRVPARASQILSLAWGFANMRAMIRRQGIAGPAAALAALRQVARPRDGDSQLVRAVAAYDRFRLLRGAHDLCLPHSLNLATMLARMGYSPEVVLGVQLGPFAAHCWVECQGSLVNDRFDRVRSYTPIRRL